MQPSEGEGPRQGSPREQEASNSAFSRGGALLVEGRRMARGGIPCRGLRRLGIGVKALSMQVLLCAIASIRHCLMLTKMPLPTVTVL